MGGFRQIGAGTLLNPAPVVMVSCARAGEKPNIITLAWAGTVCTKPPMLSLSIRPERHSHDIIKQTGEFAVNLVSRSLLEACDWCGVKSGRDVDKFLACGLTAIPAAGLRDCPAIGESPLHLSCALRDIIPLGSHSLFLAEIIQVSVQERLFASDGSMDLRQAHLMAYSHGRYQGLGPQEGFFGFSVARPEIRERRMRGAKK